MTLALVCRRWNDIIEGTPILWSRISFEDTPSYVQSSLRKSAKSPIDVYGVCSNSESSPWWDHDYCCIPLFQEVRRQSNRWRRVVLQVVDEEQPVELAPTHSPYLEFLGLFSEDEDVESSAYHTLVNSSRTPRLRELILDHIGFARWDISFPPTLSRLTIQKSPISPRQILAVLAASPNLTIFRLSGSCVPETNEGALDSTLVELTSLRKLTFIEVENDVIRDVMARLKLPSDCKVSLKCELDDRDSKASFLDPAFSRHRETFQRVGEFIRVRISLQSSEINVILQFLRWDIILRLPDPPAVLDVLEWFGISTNETAAASQWENLPISWIRPFSNIPISLELCDYSPFDLNHMNPLLNLGCITRIKLTSMTSYDYDEVLSYLAEPLVPPSPAMTLTTTSQEPAGNSGSGAAMQHLTETLSWPFPGLCELALQRSDEDVLRAVMEFVKGRSSSRVGLGHNRAVAGGSRAAQVPARLKRVELDEQGDTSPKCECRICLRSGLEAWQRALLDLLETLDEDAQVFWFGRRIMDSVLMMVNMQH
ncbi:hypothetical protein FRC05_007182 [Tulasnella sp. 425]|nr:hypothetical protein FRC05_007182 [Tulasnella sp. 425]